MPNAEYRTTRQLAKAAEAAGEAPKGSRILYVWPTASTMDYPLRILWRVLPHNCATFRACYPYGFEVWGRGATIEVVSAEEDPDTFLRGRQGRTTIIVDHAVKDGPWILAAEVLEAENIERMRP